LETKPGRPLNGVTSELGGLAEACWLNACSQFVFGHDDQRGQIIYIIATQLNRMRFTLDTNCLIDVEDGRPSALFIRYLVARNGKNGIKVAISSVGASERQSAGGYAQNFSEFQAKLKAIGFENLELLPPLAYMNICFVDHCVMSSENDTLEQDIHNVLFPNIEFMWVDYAKARACRETSWTRIGETPNAMS
jgi:hypothetical protein